jgi:hypothetical protein
MHDWPPRDKAGIIYSIWLQTKTFFGNKIFGGECVSIEKAQPPEFRGKWRFLGHQRQKPGISREKPRFFMKIYEFSANFAVFRVAIFRKVT